MLDQLKERREPIRVVIVGCGAMGKGLLYQTQVTPGLQCVGIADIDVDRAVACAREMELAHRVVCTLSDACDTIRKGQLVVCEDGEILAQVTGADVLIESSSSIVPGGRFSLAAIQSGKHLVLMNAEIDLIFGP